MGSSETEIGAVVAKDAFDEQPTSIQPRARGCANVSTAIGVANADNTSGLQHPVHFPERLAWIGQMIQHGVYEYGIKRGVFEWKTRDISTPKQDVRYPTLSGLISAVFELTGFEVDADDLSWRGEFRQVNR